MLGKGTEKVMFYFTQDIGCKKTVRHYECWCLAVFMFSFELFQRLPKKGEAFTICHALYKVLNSLRS
ncbi:hypothetical protein HMPREF3213_03126 [Heyndrickxia coagulans]|uniref:Uncharacterized protein n=1 Tax=Heyndrickxia coagulans TaxID=1398 RepID=A0A133KEM7_HEYCO|nr:hypothetical protein HMPREF3213_03126 [Heyndrickxia coagulans]